jgi:hypothetical protein
MTLDTEIETFLRTHRNGEMLLRQFMRSQPIDVVVKYDSESTGAISERGKYLHQFGEQMAEAMRNGAPE